VPADRSDELLGVRLQRLRQAAGLSIKALANAVGVADSTIHQIECGEVTPLGFDLGLRMADALNVEPDRLAGRDPRQGFPFGKDPKLLSKRTIGNYWRVIHSDGSVPENFSAPADRGPKDPYSAQQKLLKEGVTFTDGRASVNQYFAYEDWLRAGRRQTADKTDEGAERAEAVDERHRTPGGKCQDRGRPMRKPFRLPGR